MQTIARTLALAGLSGVVAMGCATDGTSIEQTQAQIQAERQRVAELEAELRESRTEVRSLESKLDSSQLPPVSAAPRSTMGDADLFPPNAKPGECYAKTLIPPTYTTKTVEKLKRAASERVEVVPARHETASERVLVKEASSRLVEVPATYETVTDTIEVESARLVWRQGKSSKSKLADSGMLRAAGELGLPAASAQPGDCFSERLIQAKYQTAEEQVLKSEASARVEIVPARYETVTEQVMVAEASERIVEVPAVYETATEQVLVKAAHQVWKKGRGPVERVDHGTGEIMCLVDVPAEYKTVSSRVLKTPATTKKIAIPAKYETVKVRKLVAPASERRIEIPAKYTTVSKRSLVSDAARTWAPSGASAAGKATGKQLCLAQIPATTKRISRRVVKTPATTRTVSIPAAYKTVKVRRLAQAASEKRIAIPAEYQTVSQREQVTEGRMEWRPVLCETNATLQTITSIQRALDKAGYDPGPIDGVVGRQTLTAVRDYQTKKSLPRGGLNYATIEALGVKVGR